MVRVRTKELGRGAVVISATLPRWGASRGIKQAHSPRPPHRFTQHLQQRLLADALGTARCGRVRFGLTPFGEDSPPGP
jgi:hypothetical protein